MTASADAPPCLLCRVPASVGVLCTAHAVAIASPRITSEQIVSNVKYPGAACVVDAFGHPHPIQDATTIGRDRSTDLVVAHASISFQHATIAVDPATRWHVTDLHSRNGTAVDRSPIADPTKLDDGATVRFGEVAFYFWPRPIAKRVKAAGKGRTGPGHHDDVSFSVTMLAPRGQRLDLRQRVDGGIVRAGDKTLELGAMEFGLLQLLIDRRRSVADPEHAYVAWHEISEALLFESELMYSENVRELVHRVRRKLAAIQAGDLIESKRLVGYRLAAIAT